MTWEIWGPPFVVVAIGLAIGSLVAWRTRPGQAEVIAAEKEGARVDLERRRETVVEALRNLEIEGPKLAPADYAAQRQALLAQGADALRQLDATPQPTAEASPAMIPELSPQTLAVLEVERKRLGEEGFRAALLALSGIDMKEPPPIRRPAEQPAIGPEWKGAIAALAIVGLAVGLYMAAGGQSVLRREGASMTGNQDLGSGEQQPVGPPARSAERAELESQLKGTPEDLAVLNRLTILALSERDAQGAMSFNERARAIDEKDAEARVNRALLRHMMGMSDKAIEVLDEVLAEQPTNAMAWLYKGVISLDLKRADDAIQGFEKALEHGAPDGPMIQSGLAEARALKEGGVPVESAPPAPGGGGGLIASGTIALDPAAEAALGQAQALFVSVKNPAGGPPLAAKKLAPGPFPMEFSITEGDRLPMGGTGPMPAIVSITLRLDFDGNAGSKSDAEPAFTVAQLATGTQQVQAILR